MNNTQSQPRQTDYRIILELLTAREKRQAALLCVLMLVNAVVESAGVASVLPFLAVLASPAMIETNPVLRSLYEYFGFTARDPFLLFLGFAALAIVIASAAVRVLTEYGILRFVEMRRHSLSMRLLRSYLRQPYSFFLNQNSTDLSKRALSDVDHVVSAVLASALRVPAYGLVTVGLGVLLLAVDPLVAVLLLVVIGGAYALLYVGISGMLRWRGTDRHRANEERFLIAAEAFGGIKIVKLLGREEAYLKRFQNPSYRFSKHQTVIQVLAQVPRSFIEALALGTILALALGMLALGSDLGRVLPLLGLYAFAGYRLLPVVQRLYWSATSLRFGIPSAEALCADLRERETRSDGSDLRTVAALPLVEGMTWHGVSFSYPGTSTPALSDVSLEIPARATVAFVGETGSGKTTAMDLLLGLLTPTAGEIRVDGSPLHGGLMQRWQRSVGYVPQDIYIADDTVAANIAFGLPPEEIDEAAAQRAARLASLHAFIVESLPQGYQTVVGERGIRLSGGQRQRLGIARALYHDPAILIFDEATSALDTVTEEQVISAVDALAADRTVVLVAHRLSTVRRADRIFLLGRGRLIESGTFEQLLARSARFRHMANTGGTAAPPGEPVPVPESRA